MKKIYLIAALMFVAGAGFSQAFFEDFTGGVIPATFTLINDNNTPHANLATFTDAWIVQDETGNNVAASCSWFTAVAPADRWMITPQITVGANMVLAWASKAQDPDYPDGYMVKISTTGTNKADFTTTAFTVAADSPDWNFHTYSLSALSGQQIYVAFIQNSTDMFVIKVDDIKVAANVGISENNSTKVIVSPNPVSDFMHIKANAKIQNVTLTNTIGQVVVNENINSDEFGYNISGLAKGLYIVTITTEKGITTEKVLVK